ncbi:MAG: GNAT family N-acetyltransferase [Alphaproteobacteria bacterium]|nr:GNAT family N-acetyltransferase [Alphaproteobacteria bacterium]
MYLRLISVDKYINCKKIPRLLYDNNQQKGNSCMPSSKMIPIHTSRLFIDEFVAQDYQRLREIAFHINHNADVRSAEGYCPFYTFQVDKETPNRDIAIRQKVSEFLIKAQREKEQTPRSTYRLAVRLLDGKLIGNVTIDMLPFKEGNKTIYGDLGYFIDPQYGSQGYATEAVKSVVHQFFKQYNRLDITTHPKNKFSQKLIERIGGVQTGYKQSSQYGNHEPRVIFEVHKADFYKNCALNSHYPDMLAVLIKYKQRRGKNV